MFYSVLKIAGGKDDSAWGETSAEGEITAGMQQIALTAEQYEQLRVQIDGDLNNMVCGIMSCVHMLMLVAVIIPSLFPEFPRSQR